MPTNEPRFQDPNPIKVSSQVLEKATSRRGEAGRGGAARPRPGEDAAGPADPDKGRAMADKLRLHTARPLTDHLEYRALRRGSAAVLRSLAASAALAQQHYQLVCYH